MQVRAQSRGGAGLRMKTFYWSMPDQWTKPAIATCPAERNMFFFMHMYQLFVKHWKQCSLNILSFYRILRHSIHFVIQVLSGRQIMQHPSYVYSTTHCRVILLYQSCWEATDCALITTLNTLYNIILFWGMWQHLCTHTLWQSNVSKHLMCNF